VRWLEGKIYRELGELDRAERELRGARGQFLEIGDEFLSGLVTLELATLVHQRRQAPEAAALAAEALEIFRALQIGRDALAALTLLQTLLGDRKADPGRLAVLFTEFEEQAKEAWAKRPRKKRPVWLDR
jgi:hypothetical protein